MPDVFRPDKTTNQMSKEISFLISSLNMRPSRCNRHMRWTGQHGSFSFYDDNGTRLSNHWFDNDIGDYVHRWGILYPNGEYHSIDTTDRIPVKAETIWVGSFESAQRMLRTGFVKTSSESRAYAIYKLIKDRKSN
jgi:hypothetical protein